MENIRRIMFFSILMNILTNMRGKHFRGNAFFLISIHSISTEKISNNRLEFANAQISSFVRQYLKTENGEREKNVRTSKRNDFDP